MLRDYREFEGATALTKRLQRKLVAVVVTTAFIAAVVYGMGRLIGIVEGLVLTTDLHLLVVFSGVFGGLALSLFEFFVVQGLWGRRLRRAPFLVALGIRTAMAMTLIFAALVAANLIFAPGRFLEAGTVIIARDILILFVPFLVAYFLFQMQRIIGGRVLLNFILGKYNRPVRENRIFLFLDLEGSTPLSLKLGDIGVQRIVSQFFFDIAEPVMEFGGETHRYVGDQVIVTWPLTSDPQLNRRCIECCFAIAATIEAAKPQYLEKYGGALGFRIGLHGGPVVASECGDNKQEIVYFGDTVNTAARIEQACKTYKTWLLLSDELLDRIDLGEGFTRVHIADAELRGRDTSMPLSTIEKG